MDTSSLAFDLVPCSMADQCRNAPGHTVVPKCSNCKLSPVVSIDSHGAWGSYWRPINKGVKHPILEKLKHKESIAKRVALSDKRKLKDKRRQRVGVQAKKAEQLTEKVIQSTANSGRKLMDGDHTSFEVTLDTKNQSQRVEPVIHWDELDKVRRDAKRSGKAVGALVLHSSNQRAAVVVALEDWVTLMRQR